tara:strand:- start:439 stop:1140 length:702 start_codon:yes stop_codon:yes gene_type:complete
MSNNETFALDGDTPTPTPAQSVAFTPGTLDLRLADCMDVMREFPDGHFDLAIVDPPYGLIGLMQSGGAQKEFMAELSNWDQPPSAQWFNELRRVSNEQIVWGGNYFGYLPGSRCWLAWDKCQIFSGADFELAWTSLNQCARIFRYSRGEASNDKRATGLIHPTQKPVPLYDWLLTNYATPGMRILDTHLGSGSHAIACHYAGMHLTACEIDPDYFAAASERIERETSQASFNL